MDSKESQVRNLILDLKRVMVDAINHYELEKSMAAIEAGCHVLYEYNQKYVDDDFENGVLAIADIYKQKFQLDKEGYYSEQNTILFYDGFGLDTRGVSKMYLNAIKKNGYHVIYVVPKSSEGKLPETQELLKDANATWCYVDFRNTYSKWVSVLISIMLEHKPRAMFFYTTPYDVAGAIAFATMEGLTDRFLIDLTDHAFWLGKKCNDYFCGSREMSASNQVYERGISKNKLIKLGVNLIIDKQEMDHSGLPFDIQNNRYVFSGGQLYKTLGDKDNTYYKIVEHILKNNPDIKFLYAGQGNQNEMNKITNAFPDRAFLIPERKDFYYLIQNCTLYLNTYPMFGGMMMKYAASAGKLPITLKHDNDSDGLLLDQTSRRIEYGTYEELVEDVDKLLNDDDYLSERESLLQGSIITEARFVKNVRTTIEEHRTDYVHGSERIDTSKFKQEFFERFDTNKEKEQISVRMNKSLFSSFPWMYYLFCKKMCRKCFRKIIGKG